MSDLVKSIKDEIKEEDLSYIKKVIKAFLSNKGVLEKQLTTLKSELVELNTIESKLSSCNTDHMLDWYEHADKD